MRGSVGYPQISRFAGTVAALWLCSAGPAWAGHGGGDVGSLQTTLNSVCTALQMASCPQLPTITQLALEIAGLENAPPQVVRFENGIPPTVAVYAVNPPAGFPFTQSNVTPLAFISPPPGGGVVAQVTQPDDPSANSFFYAATDGAAGLPPTTLFLVYDYPPLKNQNFTKG